MVLREPAPTPDDHDRRTVLRASAFAAGAAAVGALPFGAQVVGAQAFGAGAAGASTPASSLSSGQKLLPGQSLRSASGGYVARMRPDGNFVVTSVGGAVRWSTNSAGWAGAHLELPADGGLVLVYPKAPSVLYSSGTAGRKVNQLTLRDDGNLVLTTPAGAVIWQTSGLASAHVAAPPKPRAMSAPVLLPTPKPNPSSSAFTLHVLRRCTFGITPDLLTDVTKAGDVRAWLEQQLSPSSIADPTGDAVLTRFPMATIDPPSAYARMSNGGWDGMVALVMATLARQAWSKRQLFEIMVDFWSNHLNITAPSSEPWATKMWDDTHVIRANALGRFDDMLVASMRSPAMLLYLSNSESRGSAPNENYGRELLELHTVGVDAGYGHDGVINAARTLSGFSVWNPWNGGVAANLGTYRYIPSWHYVGPVKVLDWTHPNADQNAGPAAAESLARYLAMHPSTARRIVTKVATRFVSDNPPASLITALTQVYLANESAIVPVLRALFASAEFAASDGQKYRRPAEDVLATVRALGVVPDPASTRIDAIQGWYWLTTGMGNAPLGWAPPNGYPDIAAAWTGAGMTLGRWNSHIAVTQKWWTGGVINPDLTTYLLGSTPPSTRGALIDTLTARLLPGITVSAAHRGALIALLGADGAIQNGDLTWLFSVLVSTVLDSPYWSVR